MPRYLVLKLTTYILLSFNTLNLSLPLTKRKDIELETSFKLADAVVKLAIKRGLTEDRSKIDSHAVRKNLRPKSKNRYSRALAVWHS